MPIDQVKIDKSFVSSLPDNSGDRAIVEGIINIAHALGKSVTAEGVEIMGQANLLYELGCDYLQGWYFAKVSNRERLAYIVQKFYISGKTRAKTGPLRKSQAITKPTHYGIKDL